MSDTATPPLADRRIPKGGDFLPKEDSSQITPAELAARIRALQPLIAEHAGEAEAQRRPADVVWQALRDAGFFYQFVPKAYHGIETNFDGFIDAGMAIAEVDASTAWAATFCAEHNWMFASFPRETQDELWGGDFPYIVAPMVSFPPAQAEPVEGGYRVNAHWRWGTGVMHADWVIGNAMIATEGAPPSMLLVMMPAKDVEVLDTWHCMGMASTGSNDIVVKDVFVPERFTKMGMSRGSPVRAEAVHSIPIYGAPVIPFLAMSAAIPAIGAIRGMVNIFRDRMASFIRPGSEGAASEKAPAQIRLAKADMMARSAEILVRDAGRRMNTTAQLPEADQVKERIALRLQLAQAVILCRDGATLLVEGAGTSIMLNDHPFLRALRDILVVSTHVVFDIDSANELHGRALLNLPPNSFMF